MTTVRPKRLVLAALPQPPDPQQFSGAAAWMEAAAQWMAAVVSELERYSQANDRPAVGAYTLSNVTEDRTLDADSTATAELADVVGTLIQDLQSKGILS